MFKRQILIECISAFLIFLFLYAGMSKFMDFYTFTGEMPDQPLPHYLARFLVWFIPLTETALCLLGGPLISVTRGPIVAKN